MLRKSSNISGAVALSLLAITTAGCSAFGAAGPGTGAVRKLEGTSYANADIAVVDLDVAAADRLTEHRRATSFAQVFAGDPRITPLIESGDIVGVTIWEAPPAVLFGSVVPGGANGAMASQSSTIPEQPVDEQGNIAVPFVGKVAVAGRSPEDVQLEIARRLRGRAHDPQVLVRMLGNQANNVTVLGKVASTRRVPLTASGERLLDVLAAAGGPTEDVDKTTVRLTRGATAATMPLDAVILDPAQNVPLRANDVLTVIHQPYSFIALGAVAKNAEVPFEGSGLTLAQALGRIGGLRDDRADIRGVFVFRFEDPDVLPAQVADAGRRNPEGRVPVVYRLDLSDASSFFVAQEFAIRDDDVLYVSSAPGADLQKFLTTLSSAALSTIAIGNSL
ncbi:polysaccharide biosynthesis/export family protein [Qipengyuania soli]|uniref:Polysaccharide export protein n=1 Tax=Qipengyuania soli TaxID=2782568 RepID=A0A7S8ITZ6_9SPHN|nr:polysaccharide biosynthesis/export family protein [Qipengyuania soli]QPC97725.1 polysaccharide export protein [Qipengyuania soli]